MIDRHLNRIKGIYRTIQFEISSYFFSLIGLLKSKLLFDKNQTNQLEIGLGTSEKKEGFITSDINLATDFPYDLRIGLPFPDASIDFIYSEHVLEHFSYNDLILLLQDCYRVIKENGIFRLVVPNAAIYLNAYSQKEKIDDDFQKKYCRYEFGLSYKSPIDYVNYIFYMNGEHRHMFDPDSILVILSDIGFKNVHLDDFSPEIDKQDRKDNSIYVEATK